jgi:hypothetical protein
MGWTPISGFAHRDSYVDGQRRIVIPLSPPPPPGWVEIFNNPVGIAWREGKIPRCVPRIEPPKTSVVIDEAAIREDGGANQLDYVQQLIAYANDRYEKEIVRLR